ncbi:MAG: hypothetical protein COU63_04705 [Candidatus Pacebacteria bacterium CG10_big_fil_rev_8_21_14_0_10_36_11]|nr:hypothetical protein [Candidatus Pacearchaeota archaeon]OIP73991.1 MAG: hypothetical protein AUK08_01910 [Candidatus Pacebacteria bacterium CG2_30_36_39]PIR64370.1 MAG: hypothetical protein COU63_04705 [Candidatus Pacebacteria bacterium CG10_big_fil_rev_8_21_14_0_10_36_11]PJC43066.1 MAG: hypothetical protein CO040_01075 [Candidatus Pacebacteria bacterium CG_4_9_14_0_2_um_filter_36_8]
MNETLNSAAACLQAAEEASCDELADIMRAVNNLGLGYESASALLQNVLTAHAIGDHCDSEDAHAEVRSIYLKI